MRECKPCSTPVDTSAKISASDGSPVSDARLYRSLVGALQYLTFTRPDISYVVQQVCLHMHDPREPHLSAVKHILRLQALLAMDFLFAVLCLRNSLFTRMLIGQVAWTRASLHSATPCSSATIWFLGLRSGRTRSLGPVQKLSIVPWLTAC
jgi:hypothetical protein